MIQRVLRNSKLPAWAQQCIFDLEVRADSAGDNPRAGAVYGERDAQIRKITELKQEINKLATNAAEAKLTAPALNASPTKCGKNTEGQQALRFHVS